jgi:subtilisin family serine protease
MHANQRKLPAIVATLVAAVASAASSHAQMTGINVLLSQPVTPETLAALETHGDVLDVIPEIHAVTMRAHVAAIPTIQALPCVVTAAPDAPMELCQVDGLPMPDLSDGANHWTLDAINVTDFGVARTVPYDGEGVYIAVIDTGLPHNWRAYFPEERIASQFASAFCGGGGSAVTVSTQPEMWSHDTNGHGTSLTSVLLGFAYCGPDEQLPEYFNGVAPKATVIPVRVGSQHNSSERWESLFAHAVIHVVNLKVSGALGDSPLVISISSGLSSQVPLIRAAIDYAIDSGVIVVVAAGNEASAGMRYPGAYPEVISVGATCFLHQFPADDPTTYQWLTDDVSEFDPSQHPVAPFSAHELPGQELDLVAPGFPIPMPLTINGQADYTFGGGTSQACPHVAGIAALMLQKNPDLTQAQVEGILVSSVLPLSPGCAEVAWPGVGPGDPATWDDHSNVFLFPLTLCWSTNATGAGLVQADAALAATPLP